jgi:WD40 repeat protein
MGFFKFEGYVLSACLSNNSGVPCILACLSNNLLAGALVPLATAANLREPFTDDEVSIFYRKIDNGSDLVMANPTNGDIFICGKDKILKKYEYPTDKFKGIDFKKAPNAPIQELNSHSIGTLCWGLSKEFKQFATGGKDGSIILRNFNNFATGNEIKAHTLFTGGVTALCFSNSRSTLYTAGGDGCFMSWTIGGKPNPNQPINLPAGAGEELAKMNEIERVPIDEIRLFHDILTEQFLAEQE